MRDLMKRLERLEQAEADCSAEPMRIVRVIVRPGERHNPSWADTRRRRADDEQDRIERLPGEPVEAFEARAAAYFAGDYIIG